MKEKVSGILETGFLDIVVIPVFLSVISLVFLIFLLKLKPERIKNEFARYIYSLIYIAMFSIVASTIFDTILAIYNTFFLNIYAGVDILLKLLIIFLAIPLFKESIKTIKEGNAASDGFKLRHFLFLIPSLLFLILSLLVPTQGKTSYSLYGVISTVLFAPIIEEYAFRVLLPLKAKEEKFQLRDYVIASVFFQLLHLKATFITPFIISMYLYYVYKKTRSFWLIVFIHAFDNFVVVLVPKILISLGYGSL